VFTGLVLPQSTQSIFFGVFAISFIKFAKLFVANFAVKIYFNLDEALKINS
jgi:hypothetical protein